MTTLTTHAVGIDLGTTYSCIAYLNRQGEPVTLPNQEGELSTPSVVLFDGDEVIVGTEALRTALLHPEKVVQNAKRFIGDAKKRWTIDGRPYTPVDISAVILKKLLSAAQEQIGPIEQAVITVPAQFSDAQRHATMEAGHRAGLERVDIINEPVAAALCYVLGTEGMWFGELAQAQRIMVYDLGGGTFDLSLVKYEKEEVGVLCSSGDLNLGGIDWNQALIQHISDEFHKDFGEDPRTSAESMQYLANEAEQTKRSLTVRPRAALACQHAAHRKVYQVDQALFEKLTKPLVDRTAEITKRLLKDNGMGWAHVDVVLTTGGASRMPMIRSTLKKLSGRTLNTSLSPDLSIAHGATYYAGMLLTNNKFAKSILSRQASDRLSQFRQRSVNARGLGILVRHPKTNRRVPHYLIKANTPLPADVTQNFGTVVPNQRRVHLQIVESGTSADQPPAVLGNCVIDDLPPNLPEDSEIAVTISYDAQARVHVSAKDVTSGKRATTEIIRQENLVPQLESDRPGDGEFAVVGAHAPQPATAPQPSARPQPSAAGPKPQSVPVPQKIAPKKPAVRPAPKPKPAASPAKPRGGTPGIGGIDSSLLEDAEQPVPLCNECGEMLDTRGCCSRCGARPKPARQPVPQRVRRAAQKPAGASKRPPAVPPPADDEIIELDNSTANRRRKRPAAPRPRKPASAQPPADRQSARRTRRDPGEDEFWQLLDD